MHGEVSVCTEAEGFAEKIFLVLKLVSVFSSLLRAKSFIPATCKAPRPVLGCCDKVDGGSQTQQSGQTGKLESCPCDFLAGG